MPHISGGPDCFWAPRAFPIGLRYQKWASTWAPAYKASIHNDIISVRGVFEAKTKFEALDKSQVHKFDGF